MARTVHVERLALEDQEQIARFSQSERGRSTEQTEEIEQKATKATKKAKRARSQKGSALLFGCFSLFNLVWDGALLPFQMLSFSSFFVAFVACCSISSARREALGVV